MTKTCCRCKTEKPINLFAISNRNTDGRHSWCKNCSNEARMNSYRKNPSVQRELTKKSINRNREIVLNVLLNGNCIDCGETNILVLDFDHRDRTTKVGHVGEIMRLGCSVENLVNEINKCDIRCSNCHRIKTSKENNSWLYQYLNAPVV